MGQRPLRVCVVGALLVIGVACASSPGPSAAQDPSNSGKILPASLRSTGGAGVMYLPGRFRGTIEVPIDERGRAITAEAKFIGNVSNDVRREIVAWLDGLTFNPATQDGVPVRGKFMMRMR